MCKANGHKRFMNGQKIVLGLTRCITYFGIPVVMIAQGDPAKLLQ